MSSPATVLTVSDVMAAIAAQLELELGPEVDGIQVEPKIVASPTPPCVDVFPGDPFVEQATFGPRGGYEAVYVVRARVSTPDQQNGQELLLQFMDPHGPASIWRALETDASFGDVVDDSSVESVSGFQPYESAGSATASYSGTLLGAEWRVRVVL